MNTSIPLIGGGVVDSPSRTLLAIFQKSGDLQFWEVMSSSFMSISMFVSLKNSFVMITNLSEHHFRHKIYSVGVKLRSDLDELWQQMKAQADENHGDE